MPILKDDLREDIQTRPCEKCGKSIKKNADCIITFYRGSFIMLHERCSNFLRNAKKDKR